MAQTWKFLLAFLVLPGIAWSAASPSRDEVKVWETSTPGLVSEGKTLSATNCAVCHGPEGKGDGIAAAGLNPKPRNFHSASKNWKNGTSGKSMYVTVSVGLKDTLMAGFPTLSIKSRWALVHYMRSLVPDGQAEGKKDGEYEKVLQTVDHIGGEAAEKKTISIRFALDRMMKEGKK